MTIIALCLSKPLSIDQTNDEAQKLNFAGYFNETFQNHFKLQVRSVNLDSRLAAIILSHLVQSLFLLNETYSQCNIHRSRQNSSYDLEDERIKDEKSAI